MQKLSVEELKSIVKNAPLIAIDLILENPEGDFLLGLRNNQPAKGFWFVPGGRVLKNESLDRAFSRIAKAETGLELMFSDSVFSGIYQHMYPNENFSGDSSFGTHYVVLAYRIKLNEEIKSLPKDQHTEYWWASKEDILDNLKVHQNAKNYFNGYPSFSEPVRKK